MNREIEYRAFEPNAKQFEDTPHLDMRWWDWNELLDGNFCKLLDKHNAGEAFLMQYTGLKDKNGEKIFEGDVLKVINPNDEEDNLCVVKWDNLCGGYPYEPRGGFGDFDVSTVGWAMTMEFTFEVIGNIHDNPELLEEQKHIVKKLFRS